MTESQLISLIKELIKNHTTHLIRITDAEAKGIALELIALGLFPKDII